MYNLKVKVAHQDHFNELNLQLELAKFGLSPKDWKLKQQNAYTYTIQHKEDPQFYFDGLTQAKAGGKKWKRLVLKGV